MEIKIEGRIKNLSKTNQGFGVISSTDEFLEVTISLETVPSPVREVLTSAIGRDPVQLVLKR